jgi:serine/threonine-protein kinase RsbT
MAQQLGFGTTAYTMLVTAASELARNTVVHGGGGSCIADVVRIADRTGIKLVFEDHGPGIADVSLAMTDGWSSRGSLGLGLGGSKRLVHEFDITSRRGEGTRITVVRWK